MPSRMPSRSASPTCSAQHNPELADYSFYDYRAPFNPAEKRGWRIDYILATPLLVKKCTGSSIDITPRTLPKPSDHCPLYAELNYP